jgi:hypothetical protein
MIFILKVTRTNLNQIYFPMFNMHINLNGLQQKKFIDFSFKVHVCSSMKKNVQHLNN